MSRPTLTQRDIALHLLKTVPCNDMQRCFSLKQHCIKSFLEAVIERLYAKIEFMEGRI